MQETFRAIIHEMGGTPFDADADAASRATASRRAARSSTSSARRAWATIPTTSVLNANCQAHDVKNLFVADGGPFVSQADKNAPGRSWRSSMRTSEYIAAASARRGAL